MKNKSSPEKGENSIADYAKFHNAIPYGHRLVSTKSCAAKVGRERLSLFDETTAEA